MTDLDKYGIQDAIEKHFQGQSFHDLRDKYYPQRCICTIWEEVYIGMPLKDTEDKSIDLVLENIKEITGESSLKVETSCGLFYQQKLTLPNGIWYLERASGGYYILPVYRNARRFLTRLDADVAADLIISFDAYIPQILSRAEECKRIAHEAAMTGEIIQVTAAGIVHALVSSGKIKIPGEVKVSGVSANKIHVYFNDQSGVITCSLDKLEGRLLKKYGISKQSKDEI